LHSDIGAELALPRACFAVNSIPAAAAKLTTVPLTVICRNRRLDESWFDVATFTLLLAEQG
jgi:hypothetical protein